MLLLLACVCAAAVASSEQLASYPLESVLIVAPFIPGHLVPLVRLGKQLATEGHAVTLLTHDCPIATSVALDGSMNVRRVSTRCWHHDVCAFRATAVASMPLLGVGLLARQPRHALTQPNASRSCRRRSSLCPCHLQALHSGIDWTPSRRWGVRHRDARRCARRVCARFSHPLHSVVAFPVYGRRSTGFQTCWICSHRYVQPCACLSYAVVRTPGCRSGGNPLVVLAMWPSPSQVYFPMYTGMFAAVEKAVLSERPDVIVADISAVAAIDIAKTLQIPLVVNSPFDWGHAEV
jgi:hypothetical protein